MASITLSQSEMKAAEQASNSVKNFINDYTIGSVSFTIEDDLFSAGKRITYIRTHQGRARFDRHAAVPAAALEELNQYKMEIAAVMRHLKLDFIQLGQENLYLLVENQREETNHNTDSIFKKEESNKQSSPSVEENPGAFLIASVIGLGIVCLMAAFSTSEKK